MILVEKMVRFPHGLLEDLSVKIGEVEVHPDVIVLEMEESINLKKTILSYSWGHH